MTRSMPPPSSAHLTFGTPEYHLKNKNGDCSFSTAKNTLSSFTRSVSVDGSAGDRLTKKGCHHQHHCCNAHNSVNNCQSQHQQLTEESTLANKRGSNGNCSRRCSNCKHSTAAASADAASQLAKRGVSAGGGKYVTELVAKFERRFSTNSSTNSSSDASSRLSAAAVQSSGKRFSARSELEFEL